MNDELMMIEYIKKLQDENGALKRDLKVFKRDYFHMIYLLDDKRVNNYAIEECLNRMKVRLGLENKQEN